MSGLNTIVFLVSIAREELATSHCGACLGLIWNGGSEARAHGGILVVHLLHDQLLLLVGKRTLHLDGLANTWDIVDLHGAIVSELTATLSCL